jgi:Cdc6-like AAA superfamily ATPase
VNPKPLVLQGVSGVGKTAVLSTWIRHLQKSDPDGFLVYHFVGATPQSRGTCGSVGCMKPGAVRFMETGEAEKF